MIFQNSNKKPALADPVAAPSVDDSSVAMPDPSANQTTVQADSSVAMPTPMVEPETKAAEQDDQELARVLADINSQVNANQNVLEQLQAETANSTGAETPVESTIGPEAPAAADLSTISSAVVPDAAGFEQLAVESDQAAALTDFQPAELPQSSTDQAQSATTLESSAEEANQTVAPETMTYINVPIADLDELRKKALTDLRPIVDKVELNDEESFDVLLLLIRETDDESLLPRAYEAARQIQDEARRAQALLDVIKEADYFKHKA